MLDPWHGDPAGEEPTSAKGFGIFLCSVFFTTVFLFCMILTPVFSIVLTEVLAFPVEPLDSLSLLPVYQIGRLRYKRYD